jgi:hypothetical protein
VGNGGPEPRNQPLGCGVAVTDWRLEFWAASIAAQRAADLGAQLGAKAGRPQLHIVRD